MLNIIEIYHLHFLEHLVRPRSLLLLLLLDVKFNLLRLEHLHRHQEWCVLRRPEKNALLIAHFQYHVVAIRIGHDRHITIRG